MPDDDPIHPLSELVYFQFEWLNESLAALVSRVEKAGNPVVMAELEASLHETGDYLATISITPDTEEVE